MKTFADIFKKSFLQAFDSGNITTQTILLTFFIVCVLAAYIFVVYYFASKRTFYSKTFNISLALIAVITAGIILAMQSNLVISLGMVGALSIVRFRTAVKDPMDLMFLFWSISVGIICGAGMYKIAVLMSIIITIGLFALELTGVGVASELLIVNANDTKTMKAVLEIVKKYSKYSKVKSKNTSQAGVSVIVAVKSKDSDGLLDEVLTLGGVVSATLMAHDGEVML